MSSDYSPEELSKGVKRVKTEKDDLNDANEFEVTQKRGVYCAKCKNHGVSVAKKGHKGKCNHESCNCPKCILIDERREVLRLQVMKQRQCRREAEQTNQMNGDSDSQRQIKQNQTPPNVVVSKESSQTQPLSFPQIVQNYQILCKYLSATLPLQEEVYKFAVLELKNNDPILAFQHLMRTNAQLDSWRKILTTRSYQQNASSASFVPLASPSMTTPMISTSTLASSGNYTSLPNRSTLLSHNIRSTPYIPNVTTFRPMKRPDTITTNTCNYGFASMAAQKSAIGTNACEMEQNSEIQVHFQVSEPENQASD